MWYYYLAGAIVLVTVVLAILLWKQKSPKKPLMDINAFTSILPKTNIESIAFKRNKIIIEFKDIDVFDPTALQQAGAKGISIVGDVVKFYIDGSVEDNQALFQQLQNHMERM